MSRSAKGPEKKAKKRPAATRAPSHASTSASSRTATSPRPKARATSIAPPAPELSSVASPVVVAPSATHAAAAVFASGSSLGHASDPPLTRGPASRPPRARPSAPSGARPEPAAIPSAWTALRAAPAPSVAPYEEPPTGPFHTPVLDDPLAMTGELDAPQPWGSLTDSSATAVMVPPTIDDERVPTGPEPTAELAPDPHDDPDRPHDVEGEIREIEARLDELLRQSGRQREPAPRAGARALVPSDREADDEGIFGTAGRLLSTDYYLRQWGRLGMRTRAEEVDEFGLDRVYEARVMPLLEFAYRRYFRVEATGVANVPSEGACLLVSNHSGTVPLDGPMIRLAVQREHPARREVRWLAEDIVYHFPFAGAFATRIGAVRACQENAERLLTRDRLVAVFPEGIKGISKLFRQRYKLQRFGRGGYVKLALRTRAPIIPVAVVGGEETNPMLYRLQYLARGLGLPYIPVTPTFPWLGPLGLVPAPTKWSISFGEPISLDDHSPEDADDPIVVSRVNERVRTVIQSMLDSAVAARRSVFFG